MLGLLLEFFQTDEKVLSVEIGNVIDSSSGQALTTLQLSSLVLWCGTPYLAPAPLRRRANQRYQLAPFHALLRGALRDRHERWAWNAVDVSVRTDETHRRGRRSRVVPTSRRRGQASDNTAYCAGDGGKKARSPGRARSKP